MRFACLLALVACGPFAARADEKIAFRPQHKTAEQVRVKVELSGHLKMVEGDEVAPVPIKANANLEYHERRLQAPQEKLIGLRGVRYYQKADATIHADKEEIKPVLDDNRRLVVVDCGPQDRVPQLFSPSGPLSREDLDLIDVPANSLVLDQLLPGEPQEVGGKWSPHVDILAALVGLDVVSNSDVSFELTDVSDGRATVEAAGHLDGAIGGVASEIELKSRFYYDLKAQRILRFGLALREKRSIGHVAPGLDITARVQVECEPLEESRWLSSRALADVPLAPNPAVMQLVYRTPGRELQFYHDRRWFVFQEMPHLTILRLVDEGELLAQCNVNALVKSDPGKHLAGETFEKGVREALGEKCEAIVHSGAVLKETPLSVYQVIATGTSAQLPIEWHYYLLADAEGHQAAVTFTVEQPMIERLGTLDLEMLSTLEFLPAAAGKPTPAGKAAAKAESAIQR